MPRPRAPDHGRLSSQRGFARHELGKLFRTQNAIHLDRSSDDTVCKPVQLGDLGVLAVRSLSSNLARVEVRTFPLPAFPDAR
jgi:hypothetical protein